MSEELGKEVKFDYPVKIKKSGDLYKIIDHVFVRKFKVKDLRNLPKKFYEGEGGKQVLNTDIKSMFPLIAGVCEIDGKSLTIDELGEVVFDDLAKIIDAMDTSTLGFANPLENGKK